VIRAIFFSLVVLASGLSAVTSSIEQAREIHVVIGNEAADLDSIVSSMARAYVLSMNGRDGESFFAVINIPRQDLQMRRDAILLFEMLDVDLSTLFFIDEVPLDRWAEEGKLFLHLVDHNLLSIQQEHLSDRVLTIVDHHSDAGISYPACREKELMTVGSASTLIAKRWLEESRDQMSSYWATLLLAPILLDTRGLEDPHTTTHLDVRVVEELAQWVESPIALYESLKEARFDTKGFTPKMLLRKDMKRYRDVGVNYTISSLPSTVNYHWHEQADLYNCWSLFRQEEEVPISMILGRDSSDQERRLHVQCESRSLLIQLLFHFTVVVELAEMSLLEYVDESLNSATFVLDEPASRKVLQPCLRLSQMQTTASLP